MNKKCNLFCVNKCKKFTKWFEKVSQNVLRFISFQKVPRISHVRTALNRRFLPKRRKRKSSEILEFQSFALIYYLLSRCVRDSNPWPHAWQACILTNWTNAPWFHFSVAISLDCGCKGRRFFWTCNSCDELFFDSVWLCLLYILILRIL